MVEEILKNSKSNVFYDLYQKTSKDIKVVKIKNIDVGITIVRGYNEESDFFKDGKCMLIKLYMNEEALMGSVEMVKNNNDDTYSILDSSQKKYKKRVTNLYFNQDEKIYFDFNKKKFIIPRKWRKDKNYDINDFVDLLVKNHLSDRLFLKRKINSIKVFILKTIFWFMDSKYDWIEYYHKIHKEKRVANQINVKENIDLEKLEIEPFFKYFKIYRKILFSFIVFITILIYIFFLESNVCIVKNESCSLFRIEYLSIGNPVLLFTFFIGLFILHYFSLYLQKKVTDKKGFIYKLHNSSLNNTFILKK